MGAIKRLLEAFRRWLQRRLRRMITYLFIVAGVQVLIHLALGASGEQLATGYVMGLWTASLAAQWTYRAGNPKNRPKKMRPFVAAAGLLFLVLPAVSGMGISLVYLLLNGPLGDGFDFAVAGSFVVANFYIIPTAIGLASVAPSIMRERGTPVEKRLSQALGISVAALLVLLLVSIRSSVVVAWPSILAAVAWVLLALIVHRVWNPHVSTDLPAGELELDDEALLERDPWMALRRV